MKKSFYRTNLLPMFAVWLLLGCFSIWDAKAAEIRNVVSFNAEGVVKGRVLDEKNEPLPGVNILLKGTTKGVSTDLNGSYQIEVSGGDPLLIFSFVGFQSQEVVTGGRSEINITLLADTKTLSELVVVGYGVQKKVNLTGSVATVDSKQLSSRPVSSVGNALQGTMAGVAVTAAASGQPGRDGGTIRVRGIGTLNNSNAMVMVDGVVSSMNNVNPDDIETISVLKDAASAAIYGSRGANGVILITTKRGKKGTAQVNYRAYIGKTEATYLPDFLPSWQAAGLYNQALVNEGKAARWTDAEIQKFRDGSDPYNYPDTDWLDLFYKGSGIQQNHYVDVSGGSEKTQYLFSLGSFSQKGLVKETDTKRYTFRSNITSAITTKLKANANIAFTNSIINEPSNPITGEFTQLVRQINRVSPTVPYKYENGNYGYISDGSAMAWLEGKSFNKENYYDLTGNVGLDWEPLKGLHFRPMLAYVLNIGQTKKFISDQQYYNAQGTATFYQGPNSVTDGSTVNTVVTNQYLLDYTKSFGKHNVGALAGYSQELTKYTWDQGFRKNLLNNELSQINLGSSDGQTTGGYAYELALQSYFGRLNYDFDGKYLFEANIRRDGSSRFADGNRWGVFPSFSAGWNMDRESFFQPLENYITTFKIRASWGKLGNQTLRANNDFPSSPYYPYITTISSNQNYTFGGTSAVIAAGVGPVNGANSGIKWETTTMKTVGADLSFLKNRLTLTVDYFDKQTDDILLAVPVGGVYGLNAQVQNAGSVKNTGWEFSVGYNGKKGDFTYNGSLNASFIKNEITDLHDTGPIISGYTFREVGFPIDGLYGYVAEGIFQSTDEIAAHAKQSTRTAPGDLKYKDINGDGLINTSDRQYLGTSYPKTTFGFNVGGAWKGLDLSVFFQGAAGVKSYTDGGKLGFVSQGPGKPTSVLLDSWTPENTSAELPRILSSFTQNDPSSMPSSFWIKSGSYLRLKNLQLGYSLPEKWLKGIKLQKVRFYYSGQNILTLSSLYKWVDPEAPNVSSVYYYPQVKVNTIGFNVTF